ncbi:MAG: hypothetical protein JSR46_07035, partial [Verrucomicrobia bacterium]|nr:hypothetical protein [Verrucomicrobiota bacterium]
MIVPGIEEIPFCLKDYLTQKERDNLLLMKGKLREYFEGCLLCYELPSTFDSSRQILDLYDKYSKWQEGNGEGILLTLLKGSVVDLKVPLKQLSSIIDKGFADEFFAFASTAKGHYYSAEIIVEMIDLFTRAMEHLPLLPSLLPYDAGGKEMLIEAIKKPYKSKHEAEAPLQTSTLDVVLSVLRQHSFEKARPKLFEYLGSLREDQRLPVATYLSVIKQIDQVSPTIKNRILAVILVLTTDEQRPLASRYSDQEVRKLVHAATASPGICSDHMLSSLALAPQGYKGVPLEHATSLFSFIEKVYEKKHMRDDIISLLGAFSKKELSFDSLLSTIQTLATPNTTVFAEDDNDVEVLRTKFSGKGGDTSVLFPLPAEKLSIVLNHYSRVEKYCESYKLLQIDELVKEAAKVKEEDSREEATLKLLAIGRLAMFHIRHEYAYSTQVCAILAELSYPEGAVAQVKTGEGKSLNVALLAFVLAQTRKGQGHIISSDRELAMRDQAEFADFFKTFGIMTAHICEDFCPAKRFQADLLYGTASDFEFALMRELLYATVLFPKVPATLPDKPFSWVIVDEL